MATPAPASRPAPAVRPATAGDCPGAAAMVRRAFALQVAPGLPPEGEATFRAIADARALEERLATGSRAWVAVAEDGRVVGYAEREGTHLYLLFVHPEHQRRGIARRLLAAAVAGIPGATVTVHATAYALPAYTRLGFRVTGPAFTRGGLTATPMALHP